MEPTLDLLTSRLREADAGGLVGIYLVGSAVTGALRPNSDLDVLALTRRSLSHDERESLSDLLLRYSGRRATVAPGRPLEVTSLVLTDVVPWRYPPTCDYLYGEWLRDGVAGGALPERHADPDLAVLLTMGRQHARPLYGRPLAELVDPVPEADLMRCVHDSLDPLLDDLRGDERNVLLTLARMVVTLRTGQILPKDVAAQAVLDDLPTDLRPVLELAAKAYVGEVEDDWEPLQHQADATAAQLADLVRRLP